jgi:hypothetical protein
MIIFEVLMTFEFIKAFSLKPLKSHEIWLKSHRNRQICPLTPPDPPGGPFFCQTDPNKNGLFCPPISQPRYPPRGWVENRRNSGFRSKYRRKLAVSEAKVMIFTKIDEIHHFFSFFLEISRNFMISSLFSGFREKAIIHAPETTKSWFWQDPMFYSSSSEL